MRRSPRPPRALGRRVAESIGTARLLLDPVRIRRMRRHMARCRTVKQWLSFAGTYLGPGAQQSAVEASEFLAYVAAAEPRRICEIGVLYGGNTLVMSRLLPVEQVIGVDVRLHHTARLRAMLRGGPALTLVEGSTSDPRTLARVERALGGQQLDLLFIDGDHRFAGLRHDFLTYRRFVRPGGFIAFHDIQPDGRTHGGDEGPWGGDVPALWGLLRQRYPAAEFIADPAHQQAAGIGVLSYSPDVEITEADLPVPERLNPRPARLGG